MRLRVTDDAPANLSYPYTGDLAPGDEFEVDAEKGRALHDTHGYLEVVEHEETVREEDGPPDYAAIPPDYESMTYDELYDVAADHGIDGRSSMDKDELIDALEDTE